MENVSSFYKQKDKSNLFSKKDKLYWKRIYEIQEDVLSLNRDNPTEFLIL